MTDPVLVKNNMARHSIRRTEWLLPYKSKSCLDCGKTFPPECMDFDHRPGEIKLFNIGGNGNGRAKEQVLKEIAKCDLICSSFSR